VLFSKSNLSTCYRWQRQKGEWKELVPVFVKSDEDGHQINNNKEFITTVTISTWQHQDGGTVTGSRWSRKPSLGIVVKAQEERKGRCELGKKKNGVCGREITKLGREGR
jgi:hypothetical protein